MFKGLFLILVLVTLGVYTYPSNEPEQASVSNGQSGRKNIGFVKKMLRNMSFGISSPSGLVTTGMECCADKDYTEALRFFDKAIKIQPDAENFAARGLCYEQQGRLDLAILDYEEAIRASKYYKDKYRRRLIQAYMQLGDWEKAEYQTLELKETDDIWEVGKELCLQKQYEAAIRCFHKVIIAKPCTSYYTSRGQCRIRMGDLKNAREDFERGAELDPYLSRGHAVEAGRVRYCQNLIKFGKFADAVKEIPAMYHIQLAELAKILYEQEEYEKAIPFYTAAIDAFPKRAEYYRKRGKCYKEMKDFGKALLDFQKVMELQPGSASSCVDLIEAMVEVGEYEDAKNVLKNNSSILSTDVLSSEDVSRLQAAKNKMK